MRDARASLLDFAIAASIAVVPVLLAVLLSLGTMAPSELHSMTGESHVSVREVAALKTFERAIVKRDTVEAGAPVARGLIARIPACKAQWAAPGHATYRAIDPI